MPRRVYSHNVADVHIVAREALGYLLGEWRCVSLMFASSCMVLLSFGGDGEDGKVEWPGWSRLGRGHRFRTRSSLILNPIYAAMCW